MEGRRTPIMRATNGGATPERRLKPAARAVLAFVITFAFILGFLLLLHGEGSRLPLWIAVIVAAAIGLLGVLATANRP